MLQTQQQVSPWQSQRGATEGPLGAAVVPLYPKASSLKKEQQELPGNNVKGLIDVNLKQQVRNSLDPQGTGHS